MREKSKAQRPLLPTLGDHPIARELAAMSALIDELPEILDLVYQDLVRNLKNPDAGRNGLSADLVLRLLVLKQFYSEGYEDLAFRLVDSESSRAFCRLGYDEKLPKASTIQENIKLIRPSTIEAINRALLGLAKNEGVEKGRKVRVDSTITETNIHKPAEHWLLFDVVRVLSRILGRLRSVAGFRFPFTDHTRAAKKRYLDIMRVKKKQAKERLYRALIELTNRTLKYAQGALNKLEGSANTILKKTIDEIQDVMVSAAKILDQTKRRVFEQEKVPAKDKIHSIFEPHTALFIKRHTGMQFGHKVSLTQGTSGLILDCVIEEGNPADSTRTIAMIDRQEEIFGQVPRQASFDRGYSSKENLAALKARGVKDVCFGASRGMAVSDMVKSTWVYKRLRCFRAGIEGTISFLKRCFGLDRCTWRGWASFQSYVWGSVLSANLLILARHRLKDG